ncbi:unnamed protein product [Rotaria sp. Silwood2]|nr:unnamed protein product [Rotaria sp. Silwood2]CAF4077836.1 unnamed protein product [Rotaria sp. Silwood2]
MISIFEPFESKFIRPQLSDIINKDSTDNIILSTNSQDDQSVFLDEDHDPITTNIDNINGKTNSSFTENHDHECLKVNSIIDDNISTYQVQRRKSVSSRF